MDVFNMHHAYDRVRLITMRREKKKRWLCTIPNAVIPHGFICQISASLVTKRVPQHLELPGPTGFVVVDCTESFDTSNKALISDHVIQPPD
jgi:hypothetical protein